MKPKIHFTSKSIEIDAVLKSGNKHTLEAVLFVPQNWNVNSQTVSTDELLKTLRSKVSYYTSKAQVKRSVLKHYSEEGIDHHLFLFAHLYRQYLKTVTNAEDKESAIKQINNCNELLGMLRNSQPSPMYRYVDDVCSWQSEQYWMKAAKKFGHSKAILALIRDEQSYRKQTGYSDTHTDTSVNALRLKRSYLENYVTCHARYTKLGGWRTQSAYSIAACLSMVFAMSAAFGGQMLWGNLSANFFAVMVVGYIFKDRFKELFRSWVLEKISRGKPQYRIDYLQKKKKVMKSNQLLEYGNDSICLSELSGYHGHLKFESLTFKKCWKVSDVTFEGYSRLRDTISLDLSRILSRAPKSTVEIQRLVGDKVKSDKVKVSYTLRLLVRSDSHEKFERYDIKVVNSKISKVTKNEKLY